MADGFLEKLLAIMKYGYASDNLPKVQQPPEWEPEPLVTGGQDFAKEVYAFNQKYPRAKRGVSRVTIGPTQGTIISNVQSNLDPMEFADLNRDLLGAYSNPKAGGDKSIGISPRFLASGQERNRSYVLGHEMAHALGQRSDSIADLLGEQWKNQYHGTQIPADIQAQIDGYRKNYRGTPFWTPELDY